MALLNISFGRKDAPADPVVEPVRIITGDTGESESYVSTYDNRNITFTGDLKSYDYDAILRDKQRNINRLYELSDYYIDKDPIYRGIIKGVYAPFSVSDWKLIGANEQTKRKYEDYYVKIGLRDFMNTVFYQYYKYGNVYIYLMEDGSLRTLPVHKCRISNLMIDGEPVVEYNSLSVTTDIFNQGTPAEKPFVDDEDIKERMRGFPEEISKAVQDGNQWIQLNPENTFVLQDLKEDWMRYAIPLVASCLTGLSKKALIEKYETAILNLGANSFVHVRYGDESGNFDLMPNANDMRAISRIFRNAMTGNALAVTNPFAKAEVIQPKTDDLFKYNKYKDVNEEILAAGGISGIIVSGISGDGSTFASAQVSVNTADKRIELARKNFCELMNKINQKINGRFISKSASAKVPMFTLMPVDLSGSNKFQKACMELWKEGCVSTQTLLQTHGFDFDQELARKRREEASGAEQVLRNSVKPSSADESADPNHPKGGRPTMDDTERNSDPANAMTGKQPKPSNPEGSME